MKLRCKLEPLSSCGDKIFDFTKGKVYEFTESIDPPGWETRDDKGFKEVFFDITSIFETIEP